MFAGDIIFLVFFPKKLMLQELLNDKNKFYVRDTLTTPKLTMTISNQSRFHIINPKCYCSTRSMSNSEEFLTCNKEYIHKIYLTTAVRLSQDI